MPNHHIFLPLPDDLYREATDIARMQGLTLSDLLIEALSETVERLERNGWIAERAQPQAEQRMHLVRSA